MIFEWQARLMLYAIRWIARHYHHTELGKACIWIIVQSTPDTASEHAAK